MTDGSCKIVFGLNLHICRDAHSDLPVCGVSSQHVCVTADHIPNFRPHFGHVIHEAFIILVLVGAIITPLPFDTAPLNLTLFFTSGQNIGVAQLFKT